MCSPFTIDFLSNSEDVFTRIKAEITAADGTINGDSCQGSFNIGIPLGTISGTYTINSQQIEIIVTHKPFLVPCSTIESGLLERFREL